MALERGLDLLKTLKNLRLVGLQNMEVGISNGEEQVCVAKNRPQVEIGLEVLWRHVKCGVDPFDNTQRQSDQVKMPSFLRSAAAGALKTNGRHIGSLSMYLFQGDFVDLLEHCPSTFPQLTAIKIGGRLSSREESLSNLTDRYSAGLKWVDLFVYDKAEKSFNLAPGPIGALSKHSHTFEVLHLTGEISVNPKLLNNLLCSAPKLKELYFSRQQ
ncbi:MAG: hypothetical protein J3R72DRAFT_484597 [Linnemannia gamsii]|nr:MAG: hypothetical protein J3R72DRAFT_484597 [Linnemannia gamsii]